MVPPYYLLFFDINVYKHFRDVELTETILPKDVIGIVPLNYRLMFKTPTRRRLRRYA